MVMMLVMMMMIMLTPEQEQLVYDSNDAGDDDGNDAGDDNGNDAGDDDDDNVDGDGNEIVEIIDEKLKRDVNDGDNSNDVDGNDNDNDDNDDGNDDGNNDTGDNDNDNVDGGEGDDSDEDDNDDNGGGDDEVLAHVDAVGDYYDYKLVLNHNAEVDQEHPIDMIMDTKEKPTPVHDQEEQTKYKGIILNQKTLKEPHIEIIQNNEPVEVKGLSQQNTTMPSFEAQKKIHQLVKEIGQLTGEPLENTREYERGKLLAQQEGHPNKASFEAQKINQLVKEILQLFEDGSENLIKEDKQEQMLLYRQEGQTDHKEILPNGQKKLQQEHSESIQSDKSAEIKIIRSSLSEK